MRTIDAAGVTIGPEAPPRVMGVLNVSSESPYKPSVYDDPGEAAAYVDEELIGEGADIVDVGLESANKRLDVLSAAEELDRLEVAVEAMASTSGDAVFSIETRYAEVAEAALDAGFDMVNDICGFADPRMPAVCAEYDVAVGKMASPPDLRRPGAVDDVDWAERRSPEWADAAGYVDRVYEALTQNGFTEKTIVDPAFGGWSESKTLADDRALFRRLGEFRGFGRPILVSINRKNFLRQITGRSTEAALPVSLAATSLAVERGARVIRTHDVRETVDAARVGSTLAVPGPATDDHSESDEGVRVRPIPVETDDGGDLLGDGEDRVFEVRGLAETTASDLAGAVDAVGGVTWSGSNPDALLLSVPTTETETLAGRLAGADAPGLAAVAEGLGR